MKPKFEGLRVRRLSAGLTIEELAAKVGLTASMVRAVEVGAQKGSLMTRARLADALKIPLRYLVSKQESEIILGLARPVRKAKR